MAHKNDAATYEFYKRHEEAVLAALAEGRKPPRRPKRSELIGIPEYRALLERGMPNRDLTTARDESFLKEGLFAAEPVMPTKESCNPELQERKRGQGELDEASENEGVEGRNQEVDRDPSDADVVLVTTAPEDQPRSRAERRSRRNLIVDDEDLVQADGGAAAATPAAPGGAEATGATTDAAPSTPTAAAAQESAGENETAAMTVKSPLSSEEKREGEDKSNLPTACCTGSPASHKDHKESVEALDAQPVKAEPVVATVPQTQAEDTKREVPVVPASPAAATPAGTPAAQSTDGQVKAQEPSPESDRSDLKNGGGEKAAKTDAANTPRVQRLLIFTQFQLVLDELEAYCKYRGWRYLR